MLQMHEHEGPDRQAQTKHSRVNRSIFRPRYHNVWLALEGRDEAVGNIRLSH